MSTLVSRRSDVSMLCGGDVTMVIKGRKMGVCGVDVAVCGSSCLWLWWFVAVIIFGYGCFLAVAASGCGFF